MVGKFTGNQANLAAFAEPEGHGFRAILTKPEVFNGASLATNGRNDLFATQRTFSTHVSEVNAEQATLPKVSEGCGTSRIKTL